MSRQGALIKERLKVIAIKGILLLRDWASTLTFGAMGDATDELKAVADYITLDVDHNGLVAAVKKFLL